MIGDRSIGGNAERVGKIGLALIKGLTDQGIIACGKHFPGHGDTAQDSHWELPRLPHAMNRLKEIELAPFQYVINAIDDAMTPAVAIMSAHVVFEAINDSLPGTLCPEVMQGMLRDTMNFNGLCVSDCLEMKAIADGEAWSGTVGAAVKALQAGVDMPLICHTPATMHAAIDATHEAVNAGELKAARLTQAAGRLQRVRDFRRAAKQAGAGSHQPSEAFQSFVATEQAVGQDPTRESY